MTIIHQAWLLYPFDIEKFLLIHYADLFEYPMIAIPTIIIHIQIIPIIESIVNQDPYKQKRSYLNVSVHFQQFVPIAADQH